MILFLDIETDGDPFDGRLLRVGYAVDKGDVSVIDPLDTEYAIEFFELLANPDIIKVSHSTYDPRWLKLSGHVVAGEWRDTKVMAWVLNENTPLDIDWLAYRYAGIDMDKRLKRSAGRVMFRDDDDQLYDLAQFDEWPGSVVGRFENYCGRDVKALQRLYYNLLDRLQESEWESYWLREEVPFTNVLVDMECRGMPVDLAATSEFAAELEVKVEEERQELLRIAGLPESFNLNSQPQMVAYLFSRHFTMRERLPYDEWTIGALKSCISGEHEDCPVVVAGEMYTDEPGYHVVDLLPEGFVLEKVGNGYVHGYWSLKGRGLKETPHNVNKVTGETAKLPSVSAPDLLFMHSDDPWVLRLCVGYRKMEKLLTTYLRVFPKVAHHSFGVDRIFAHFNQTGTVTGRLSSSEPNLQNQPARGELGKRTRGLFVGNFIIGDYDQLEMRLMAHFSEDPRLLKVFRDGLDPHLITAQAIFGDSIDPHGEERGIGKTLNFAIGYGAGARKVAQVLSLAGYPTTKDTAAGYLAELQGFYRGFYRWKDRVMANAKRKGSVRTIGGRRRRLRSAFKDTANWKAVGYGERQAVNAIIQGSAADILRRVMVATDRDFPQLGLLAQVHDELIWEYDPAFYPDRALLEALGDVTTLDHGFDLRVPLMFEPQIVKSWAEKGEGIGFAELFDDEDGEEL